LLNTGLAAPCGLYCGECEHLPDKCSGCGQVQGKPFWTAQFGVETCPLYGCCVIQKNLEHCGLCPDFTCQMFDSMRDPSMSDEEAEQSMQKKINDLKRRKEIGTEAWLKEQ
jgi:hypothetical protein